MFEVKKNVTAKTLTIMLIILASVPVHIYIVNWDVVIPMIISPKGDYPPLLLIIQLAIAVALFTFFTWGAIFCLELLAIIAAGSLKEGSPWRDRVQNTGMSMLYFDEFSEMTIGSYLKLLALKLLFLIAAPLLITGFIIKYISKAIFNATNPLFY